MILEPKLAVNNENALWDVEAILLWDPLGIGKQHDKDWANSTGLPGLIAVESNYMAAPGDMVDHSQFHPFYYMHKDCFTFSSLILI